MYGLMMRAKILQSRNFFGQVSDCLSRKIIWDTAEYLVLQRKMKSQKYTILCLKWTKIHECSVLNDIFVIYGLMMRAEILQSRKFFWQFSDCLSRKIIWDPAEHLALTRKMKSQKYTILGLGTIQTHEYSVFMTYMSFVVLWWEQSFLESRNLFWQVSDCLSRKIIWDPAEHLVLTQEMKKWEMYEFALKNDTKTRLYCIKLTCFMIFGLVVRAEISADQKFFLTSLRLFVKENYLRSRRAPCADTKNGKVRIMSFCTWMTRKIDYIA